MGRADDIARDSASKSFMSEVYDEASWAERMRNVKVDKSTMCALVMNWLVVEGHKEAAERFQEESGTNAGSLDAIGDRRAVRMAIERGDVPSALALAEPLLPDASEELHFALRQQQLIELIRRDDIEAAVAYAQEELAPRAEQSAALRAELERTMLLLAFDEPSACPDGAELLSQQQRKRIASMLNAAILGAQAQETEAMLPLMLKRLMWEQDDLQNRQGVSFPRIDNLEEALPRLCEPSRQEW